MNRAQRRMQEKQSKKAKGTGTPNDPELKVNVEMIQPWSDVLMRTTLPDAVVEGMIKITDEILAAPEPEISALVLSLGSNSIDKD